MACSLIERRCGPAVVADIGAAGPGGDGAAVQCGGGRPAGSADGEGEEEVRLVEDGVGPAAADGGGAARRGGAAPRRRP